ncbi:MAG: hypothetical protein WBC26_09435 [Alphaproteobacteria bacterium]
MEKSQFDWNWIPQVSVGSFVFDKKIEIEKLAFETIDVSDREEDWRTYEIKNEGSRFYISKDGSLQSIECQNVFLYKGINFIGSKLQDIEKVVNFKFEIGDCNEFGREIVNRDIGITLWEEYGIIASVSADSGNS